MPDFTQKIVQALADYFSDAFVCKNGARESAMITYKDLITTQVNRMSRSRRVLAIGGKQRIFGLDMVCIETILFHLDSL